MNRRSTMRSTISVAVVAAMLAGCAAKSGEISVASDKHFGGRSNADLGTATRALAALGSNDFDTAIRLAERAVEKSPQDAGIRTLLGNAYFGGGRFHSAEQAFEDALTLYGAQPSALLKLALVEIAQGKNDEALRTLDRARGMIDASDFGLALALAGRPDDAIAMLDEAARQRGADARVRQNLALAYALSGDWNQARVVASQDVAPTDLDDHLKQWMALANPAKPSDQVAALLGVVPAVSDAGQPVRLALSQRGDNREAAAAPVAPTPAPAVVVAVAASPAAAPLTAEAIDALPPLEIAQAPAPAFAEAAVPPAPPPADPVRVAAASPAEAPMAMVAVARAILPKVKRAVAAKKARAPMALASAPAMGKSRSVVQLGAYNNRAGVQQAWNRAAAQYAVLRDYTPMSARFDSGKRVFYRLSVKGFANQAQAAGFCSSLKKSGRACFVRGMAGDTPIEIASR